MRSRTERLSESCEMMAYISRAFRARRTNQIMHATATDVVVCVPPLSACNISYALSPPFLSAFLRLSHVFRRKRAAHGVTFVFVLFAAVGTWRTIARARHCEQRTRGIADVSRDKLVEGKIQIATRRNFRLLPMTRSACKVLLRVKRNARKRRRAPAVTKSCSSN